MTAGTSITIKRIGTCGEKTLYEIKGTISNGETLDISHCAGSAAEITTSSIIQMIGVNNVTDGSGGNATCSAVYTAATRLFTITDASASDDDVRVLFYVGD